VRDITPEMIPSPNPLMVSFLLPLISPRSVNVPDVVASMVAVLDNVISPIKVALAPVLVIAPIEEIPVPLIVKGSVAAPVSEDPFKSKVALPEVSTVPVLAAPKGPEVLDEEDTPNFMIPYAMVVVPVKVFAPESIKSPVPSLVIDPVPLMIPANAAGLELSVPMVRVAAPNITLPPLPPPPVSEPTVLSNPVISKITPEVFASVTAEFAPNALVEIPAASLPPLIVVGPV
jgi:hypothetical protein